MNIQNGIHYLDPNPGGEKAILLLHGLGADCESWPFQLPVLAGAGWRPLALDLPGFGLSPRYEGRWTIRRTAQAVFEFTQRLRMTTFSLAGISMGGTVAIQMALENPQSVDRLVLINTFARLKPGSVSESVYFLRRFFLVGAGERPAQADYVARRIFPDDSQQALRGVLAEKILAADPVVYREAMVSLALFRALKQVSRLTNPTLVISGEADTTVALETQKKLAASIPGARQVIIKNGGHGVTIDHPDQVNSALTAFLA